MLNLVREFQLNGQAAAKRRKQRNDGVQVDIYDTRVPILFHKKPLSFDSHSIHRPVYGWVPLCNVGLALGHVPGSFACPTSQQSIL